MSSTKAKETKEKGWRNVIKKKNNNNNYKLLITIITTNF